MRQTLIVLVATVAALAQAQKADPFDVQIASVIMLQDKGIQKELKVTEKQRDSMNRFAEQHRGAMTNYQKELERKQKDPNKPLPVDANRVDGMFLAMKRSVLSVLTPPQLKRLREISLQQLDFVALVDDVVAKRVGIPDAQLKKLKAIYEKGIKEVDELAKTAKAQLDVQTADLQRQKPKTDAEAQRLNAEFERRAQALQKKLEPEINRIRAAGKKAILAQLTVAQKAAWQALLGKPFSR